MITKDELIKVLGRKFSYEEIFEKFGNSQSKKYWKELLTEYDFDFKITSKKNKTARYFVHTVRPKPYEDLRDSILRRIGDDLELKRDILKLLSMENKSEKIKVNLRELYKEYLDNNNITFFTEKYEIAKHLIYYHYSNGIFLDDESQTVLYVIKDFFDREMKDLDYCLSWLNYKARGLGSDEVVSYLHGKETIEQPLDDKSLKRIKDKLYKLYKIF